jgi:hypothetical protein
MYFLFGDNRHIIATIYCFVQQSPEQLVILFKFTFFVLNDWNSKSWQYLEKLNFLVVI